jgi:hypothetical protein
MRAWTYHVPVPAEHTRIDYADVRMDQAAFDYEWLLAHWDMASTRFGAETVICRGDKNTDPTSPMYERVVAMCREVDRMHYEPIVFLDSDAFLNQPIDHIFDGDWDIGVTYRHNMEMALNEGVIFANNKRPDAVRSFFREYLATYDRLCADPAVLAKYNGNIKRWRGGQLSLNTLACSQGLPSALDLREVAGARVAYFPCWKWNYSCNEVNPRELDTKAVIHLKGARKHLLDDLIRYQEGKLGRA